MNYSGKTAFISGPNGGLGFEATKAIAQSGISTILLACRTYEKAIDTQRRLEKVNPNVNYIPLSGFDTTYHFYEICEQIDLHTFSNSKHLFLFGREDTASDEVTSEATSFVANSYDTKCGNDISEVMETNHEKQTSSSFRSHQN